MELSIILAGLLIYIGLWNLSSDIQKYAGKIEAAILTLKKLTGDCQ